MPEGGGAPILPRMPDRKRRERAFEDDLSRATSYVSDIVTRNPLAAVALWTGWVAIGAGLIGGLMAGVALLLSTQTAGGGALAFPALLLLPISVIAAIVAVISGTKGRRTAAALPEQRGLRPSAVGRGLGAAALVVALIGLPAAVYGISTSDDQVERELDRFEEESRRRSEEFLRESEEEAELDRLQFEQRAREDCIRQFTGKVDDPEAFCP